MIVRARDVIHKLLQVQLQSTHKDILLTSLSLSDNGLGLEEASSKTSDMVVGNL